MDTIQQYQDKKPKWKPSQFGFKGNADNKAFIKEFCSEHGFDNEGSALDYIIQSFQHGAKGLAKLSEDLDIAQGANVSLRETLREKEKEIQMLMQGAGNAEVTKELEELEELKAEKLDFNDRFEKALLDFAKKYPQLKGRKVETIDEFFGCVNEVIAAKDTDLDQAREFAKIEVSSREDFKKLKEATEIALPKICAKIFPGVANEPRIPISDELLTEMLIDHAFTDKNSVFPSRAMAEKAVKQFKK